jgi:hypothetical protein
VNRVRVTSSRRRRVYTFWAVGTVVALITLTVGARAQPGPETGADPAMIKGAANAPVVIVEFSDYQ